MSTAVLASEHRLADALATRRRRRLAHALHPELVAEGR